MHNSHRPPPSVATDAPVSSDCHNLHNPRENGGSHSTRQRKDQFLPGDQSLHLASQGIQKVS